MSKVERLCYLGLNAKDLDAWRDFAAEVLAMEVSSEGEARLHLRMDDHHHRFIIHQDGQDDLAYAGWQVRDAEALRALTRKVESQGIAVTAGTADEAALRRVQGFSWFVEPCSGLRLELAYGPECHFLPAFRPARPIAGYKTGELGLGHVAIYVNDLMAAERFYVDVMGFGVSDWIVAPEVGNVVAFLHCNPRHHSLALMVHPAASRKINHVMFEALSIDDVGNALDVCKDRDLVAVPLGRHMNDRAISFYFRTPSGWHCEIGSDAREIDPRSWCAEYYSLAAPRQGEWGHEGVGNIL